MWSNLGSKRSHSPSGVGTTSSLLLEPRPCHAPSGVRYIGSMSMTERRSSKVASSPARAASLANDAAAR